VLVMATITVMMGATVASGPPAEAAPAPPIGTITSYANAGVNGPRGVTLGPDGNLWFTSYINGAIGRITPAGAISTYTNATISGPLSIAAGPDGALWFTNTVGNSIGRITTTGTVSTYTAAGVVTPEGITAGPDGNLWFTSRGNSSIGRITTGGTITTYTSPDIFLPGSITAGPDGALWFTNATSTNQIGRITTSGTTTSFNSSSIIGTSVITAGPDGALWFTDYLGDAIGRITTSGSVTTFAAGGGTSPRGIVAGPDGNLWFANYGTNSIGRITTAGTLTTYTGTGVSSPWGIATGPDGALWFTNSTFGSTTVGRIAAARLTDHPVTGSHTVMGITTGPDGALWFTDSVGGNAIGRMATDGSTTRFTDPTISQPYDITTGPDGALWFTNVGTDTIGRITTGGVVSAFPDPTIADPVAIVTGPDGALWFANTGNSSIGRVTTGGVVSSYTGADISAPGGIAVGPDGALWYTNGGSLSIGRITTAGATTSWPSPQIVIPRGIIAGPDGALWFTSTANDRIGRITTTGQLTTYTGPGVDYPQGITAGPDGALWFTNRGTNSIGRISTAGVVSYVKTAEMKDPWAITVGPDSSIWFTNATGSSIGNIVTALPPEAPSGVSAIPGMSSATVTWTAPAFDGGATIATYVVTAHTGMADGPTCTWTGGPLMCAVTGLTNGALYTFTVTASHAGGTSPPSAPSTQVRPPGADLFHALAAPTRILDSRPPPEQVGPYATPWTAGMTREVQVTGLSGVVTIKATAVTLNVTVTGTTAPSFLTIWPKGQPQPTASNLNWVAGQTIPNAVTVKAGDGGMVNVFNPSGSANVIIDVVGYYSPYMDGGGFTALSPARVLDSRPPPEQVGPYSTPWGPGTDREVTVAGGASPVPPDAEAVVLNATVTGTTAESFLTIYPNGATKPTASSLNWKAGATIPNAVTVKVDTAGKIRVFNNSGNANVIVDVVGWFKTGSGNPFHPVTPVRFQDSRPPPEKVGAYATPWSTGTERNVSVTTASAVPAGAKAVLANVTVTSTGAESFLTVWNTGAASRPTASNLNWKAGTTIANAVTAKIGTGDTISVFNNSGGVDVIADAAGWYG
jgi:streptogramin lyase